METNFKGNDSVAAVVAANQRKLQVAKYSVIGQWSPSNRREIFASLQSEIS